MSVRKTLAISSENNLLPQPTSFSVPSISKIAAPLLWVFFILSAGTLVFYVITKPYWNFNNVLHVNGFTLLIWTTVLFFSAVVSSYSKSYLHGFAYHERFTYLCLSFTVSVLFLVASSHISLLLISWLAMGFFMARLIGINSDWAEAREASKFAQKYFLIGAALFAIGIFGLAFQTNEFTLNGILSNLDNVPQYMLVLAALCIITAAIIQSAIYPFHRWLLSAMTAPTPASALMHAGFVNGAGILLTLVSTLLIASNTLSLLFIIGGLTAVIAQFTKLLQVNVKQKLACSTIAQMGFMIMQCGLGFFNAAVAHLILHGFYKAYLFLSSGEEIAQSEPQAPAKISIKPLQALVVLIFGIVGALLFTFLTNKTSFNDSSIFLTLIVAITVGQTTYNIVKQENFTLLQKAILPIGIFLSGIILYALVYNGVTIAMQEMPMIDVPQPLSIVQIVFGVLFLIGFFIMKLGVYRKVPWLYMKLLNISQPNHKTIFTSNK